MATIRRVLERAYFLILPDKSKAGQMGLYALLEPYLSMKDYLVKMNVLVLQEDNSFQPADSIYQACCQK